MYASCKEKEEIAKALIENDADIEAKTEVGTAPSICELTMRAEATSATRRKERSPRGTEDFGKVTGTVWEVRGRGLMDGERRKEGE